MLWGKKHKCELKWTMLFPMGLSVMYVTLTKWLWNTPVKKFDKNTMGMNVHKIIKQMKKYDPENWTKIVISKKWLTMTLN